jgi:hypothetical protein
MAVKYVDLASGNDSTGDGTAGAPYKTIAKGVTEAGSGGEVRVAGQAVVSIGNAAWTYGSTSVTVTGSDVTGTAAAGSYIRPKPAALALCPMYRVESSSYADGVTTITLSVTFRGASGTYASQRIPMTTLTAQEEITTAGRTVNFGWNLTTEAQPVDGDGDPSYVTGILNSTTRALWVNASCLIRADGRLFITDDGGSQVGLQTYTITFGGRIAGALDVYGGVVRFENAHEVDCVLKGHSTGIGIYVTYPVNVRIGTLVLHNGASASCQLAIWYGSNAIVGRVVLRGCPIGIENRQGVMHVGVVDCKDATTSKALWVEGSTGRLHIGELLTSQTLTIPSNTSIGAPMDKWVRKGYSGVVDRVTGRGATGYGLRFDPTSAYQPCEVRVSRPVASGKSVQLKFYAVYTGTASDPPPCYVELVEPNGLTVARYDFTPVRSAEAALADIWDDATQQTITFSGTTARDGMLTVAIRARDNAAGDAILYVDDVSWVVS